MNRVTKHSLPGRCCAKPSPMRVKFPSSFPLLLILMTASGSLFAFDEMPPDEMPTLDPAISTLSPHLAPSSDSCVGQCAFTFTDRIRSQFGSERSLGLLSLNYNEFLAAFSNSSFFESFCNIYHQFNFCYTKCPQGFMQELLGRSAEIVDHFCVWNYKEIMAKFGCLVGLDRELSAKCVRSCAGHHDAVTSLVQNFKHLALNSDPTEAEKYLGESCAYVTCTLHCDVPAIHTLCGRDTAELVVNLTRKSFGSMERMALDTGAVGKWPTSCDDIRTYAVQKMPNGTQQKNQNMPTSNSNSEMTNWLLFFNIFHLMFLYHLN